MAGEVLLLVLGGVLVKMFDQHSNLNANAMLPFTVMVKSVCLNVRLTFTGSRHQTQQGP